MMRRVSRRNGTKWKCPTGVRWGGEKELFATVNVYSEILDLLVREPGEAPAGLFGTLTAVSPLTVTIRGTAVTRGLFYPAGTVFRREDIGRELALLPCEEGFLILFFSEGGGT